MNERSDETLMLAVRNGDEAAFEQLVHRHIDALYSYALRLSRSTATAEDLVQDAWLAVWQKAHTFKPAKVKVTTWLHKILYNKFIDFARKDRLEYNNDAALNVVELTSPESAADQRETYAELLMYVADLPNSQQSALWLRHAQGFSNRDIALILGRSVRSVESLLARAKRSLEDKRENP